MTRRELLRSTVGGLAAAVLGLACSSVEVGSASRKRRGVGPPPHAPAHGYRRKNAHGVEIEFDAELGVYLVVGHLDHYFFDDRYYRRSKKRWEAGPRMEGPWSPIEEADLPPGLRDEHPGKGRGRKK